VAALTARTRGGAVEADHREVGEQRVGGTPAGRGRPEHGVADADNEAAVGGSSRQWAAGRRAV
jgi:hypothetical protein